MGEFLIPYLPSGLVTLSQGQRFSFPIAVDYVLFEKITDDTGSDKNPTLTIQLENAQSFKLKSLLQVKFNNQDKNIRFSVVNENTFPVTFIVSGGRGDVDNQRAQVVGEVLTTVTWGAAYSDTILQAVAPSTATVGFTSAITVPHVGNTTIDILGFGSRYRIPTCHIKETSGIPNAFISLCRNSGVPTSTSWLMCESGQSVDIIKPIYQNMTTQDLKIVYGNGATGRVNLHYQLDPVPSGAN